MASPFDSWYDLGTNGDFKLPIDDVEKLHSGVIMRDHLFGRYIVKIGEERVEFTFARAEVEALKFVSSIARLSVCGELYPFIFSSRWPRRAASADL